MSTTNDDFIVLCNHRVDSRSLRRRRYNKLKRKINTSTSSISNLTHHSSSKLKRTSMQVVKYPFLILSSKNNKACSELKSTSDTSFINTEDFVTQQTRKKKYDDRINKLCRSSKTLTRNMTTSASSATKSIKAHGSVVKDKLSRNNARMNYYDDDFYIVESKDLREI